MHAYLRKTQEPERQPLEGLGMAWARVRMEMRRRNPGHISPGDTSGLRTRRCCAPTCEIMP
jgi:hypothetical protein